MQTRTDSFMEAVTNTTIGLFVSTIANWTLTPWVLGHPISLHENIVLSAGFTVISVARSYILRRSFNGKSVWQAIKGLIPTKPSDPIVMVESMGISWKLPLSVVRDDLKSGWALPCCPVARAAVEEQGVGH